MKKYVYIAITTVFFVTMFFVLQDRQESTKIIDDVLVGQNGTKLNESESVEVYLRSNIKTLLPVSSVLGGSWYVVSVDLDLAQNTGTVVYEDGHIQEKRVFDYEIDTENKIIKLNIK